MGKKYKRKFFDPRYVKHERRTDRKITAIIFGSLFIAFVMHQWVIGSVVIQGLSMYPTLDDGDRFLFHKWVYWKAAPRRGDIVVIRDPMDSELEIKRVVGLPGDVVQVRDGYVRINKAPISEPYLPPTTRTDSGENGLKITLVPRDRYYVMGDNRPVSRDSRTFGPVAKHDILGKIFHPSEKKALQNI
ncbi:MAG: signal peptidase I [Candidatus Omnitrophica bacterium]|jgi:signal peptidase I|nr:signal peptidase I [Candidatus Omnitrophota bacterium]